MPRVELPEELISLDEMSKRLHKEPAAIRGQIERGLLPFGVVDRPSGKKAVCLVVRSHFEKWLDGEPFPFTNPEFLKRTNSF